jgi:hypothetical protein
VEPGSTKSVTWVTEEDIQDSIATDGIDFSAELLPGILDTSLYIRDERDSEDNNVRDY